MCAEKRELLSWIKDVSKVSGVETIIVKEHEFSRPLSETFLLFTLLITMTLAVSAAYYLKMPAGQYPSEQLQGQIQPAASDNILNEATTSTEASTTTELATTEPATTEPPTSEPTTTEATTTTTTTTTTSSTTSTTVKCGNDMETPCYTEGGLKCAPGNRIGAEGICHSVTCVKTVPSGNNDGSCGAFAMSYCDEAK